MPGDLPMVVARWCYFSSAMVIFGWSLFPRSAFDGSDRGFAAFLPAPTAAALGGLALAAAAAWLLLFAVELDGATGLFTTVKTILLDSSFGAVWIARLVLASLALFAAMARPVLLPAAAGLMLACEGCSGHAAALGAAACLVQATHVVCAGAWIGGLVPLARLLASARRHPSQTARVQAALLRFSRFGIGAVAVVALTGAANTWLIRGALPGTADPYGGVLLMKIALFALMVCLAAVNRSRTLALARRSCARPILTTLAVTIALEQSVAALVLLDVSALGLMDPGA